MDYKLSAVDLLQKLRLLRRTKLQRGVDESIQGEAFVLQYLISRGGEALPGEISSEMNVSSARIAQTLNSMERKSWVTRRIDLSDRRRILVSLTPEGTAEAKKSIGTAIELVTKLLSFLKEGEAKEYVRITGKLAQIISDIEQLKLG